MSTITDNKQIDGQITFDGTGFVENEVPAKMTKDAIVEENGMPVSYSDEYTTESQTVALSNDDIEALELLKPGNFDIRNFHSDFKDNTKRVLLQLLSMQSNTSPLKKGGDGIAYRCDALILQNRQHFTDVENTLMDIFLGMMSSYPDEKAYHIHPKDVADILGLDDESYAYKLMKRGADSISNKPLVFEITLENGKKRTLKVPWYDALTYVKEDELINDELVGIAFTPSDFFKMLTISSTISHGAHYSSRVAYNIQGQYAKVLFHYLESMKNHCAYPGARAGWFKKSLDEIRSSILYCPPTYRWADMNRRAFKIVKDVVNSRPDADFTFDYEKKDDEVLFMINKKVKSVEVADKVTDCPTNGDADKEIVTSILKGNGLTDRDAEIVYHHYKEAGRDVVFLTQALTKIATSKSVRSKTAVLCSIMDKGINQFEEKAEKKKSFSNINRQNQDYDELERLLLNSSPKQ